MISKRSPQPACVNSIRSVTANGRAARCLRIVINADDFGLSRTINERIAGLLSRGVVTSATLVANGESVEEAARLAGEHPRCSFGVHLNVTEGRPLTCNLGLRAILDARGRFDGNRVRAVRLHADVREAIYQEWAAQVQRIRSLGVPITHLDSHHHVHTLVRLFGVLKRLQKSFRINKVRLTKNIYGAREASPLLLARKRLWNFALRHCCATRTTDGFTSFSAFLERLRAGLDIDYDCVELMTHPGAAGFDMETRLVEGPWRDEINRPFELISYGEL
jgi:chitin disaccharide deacetylase